MRAIPFIILFYIGDKFAWLYQYCQGQTALVRLFNLLANCQMAFQPPWFSFAAEHMLAGLILSGTVLLIMTHRSRNAKKYRLGMEYGSARWGTAKDIAPFIDRVYENNILLTATERLTMNSRPKQPKYARNKNILVIGGSAPGRQGFMSSPISCRCIPNVPILSPIRRGRLSLNVEGCCRMADIGSKRSTRSTSIRACTINPFAYIRSEKDILKLVNALIANTKGDGEKAGEDFWVKAERLLFCALIGYLWYEAPEDEQNFTMLLELINAFEVREEDETYKNAIDLLFEDLAQEKPDHFAVRQYAKFKLAAGKTAKSILISCGARLAPFDIAELRELLAYDEMELDMIWRPENGAVYHCFRYGQHL